MSADDSVLVRCPSCGESAAPRARFCEHCGTPLGATDAGGTAPSEVTLEMAPLVLDLDPSTGESSARRPCAACGGTIADDGYCVELRHPAASPSATTSRSARPPGSPASATGACGTPATRTRWRSPRAAPSPSSWCATACRARRTPTSPRSPRAGPHGTCSWSTGPRGRARSRARPAGASRAGPTPWSPRPARRARRCAAQRSSSPRRRGRTWRTTRRRARSSPPSSTGPGRRRLAGRLPRLLAAGRRRRPSSSASTTRGRSEMIARGRAACPGRDVAPGARHHPVARPRRPGHRRALRGDRPARARLAARLLRRPVELLLRGARDGRPRARGSRSLPVTRPTRSAAALVRWANAAGRARQHHRRARPVVAPTVTERASEPARRIERSHRGRVPTEVFQNEFLSDGATDVHAIVTVTSSGAGDRSGRRRGSPGASGVAEIVSVDTSGSMQGRNIDAAKYAAQVAVDQIAGRHAGSRSSAAATWRNRAFPYPNAPGRDRADGARRPRRGQARHLVDVGRRGGTAMSTWLRLADDAVRHRSAGGAEARDPADRRQERVRAARAAATG